VPPTYEELQGFVNITMMQSIKITHSKICCSKMPVTLSEKYRFKVFSTMENHMQREVSGEYSSPLENANVTPAVDKP
jgi:hypothetical protein